MLSGHQKAITPNLVQRRHGFDADSIVVVLRIATDNTQKYFNDYKYLNWLGNKDLLHQFKRSAFG